MDQKAKKVVLSMNDKAQWGKVVILPNVGETTIGEDGEFTIDDVTATLLLGSGFGFTLVKGNGTTVTKTTENDSDDEEEEEEEEDNENDNDEEEEETEDDGLEALSLEELIGLAEAAKYDEKEYKKFKKSIPLMVGFLRKKAGK